MKTNPRKRGTQTSSFGSPGRINHDSTAFYTSRLYKGLPQEQKVRYIENLIPPQSWDKIFCKSSENMEELPDNSVHLMVTSPPYNVGKEYDEDLSLEEYRVFLKRVWKEVCRILVRGEVIWNKASSASPSTAWGSWLSASNPTLRDIHEYILVFSKGTFRRENRNKRKNSISKEEFLEFTKSVWTFSAEPAKKVRHPAPFPIELPYRLIQLYTFEGEVVLDPFMGSGQTAIATIKTNRHYVGYDIDEEYVKLAKMRIKEFTSNLKAPKLYDFV
jgi:site-specific DNA-methyltransferase (adenine-specific)